MILKIDEKQRQPPPTPPYKEGGEPTAKTKPDNTATPPESSPPLDLNQLYNHRLGVVSNIIYL
ncbi:MAG: hypothetical protein JZU65_19785, partial [Chlorobium sp.]|nr:hypothetical protein [Chlorobium sp.]